MYKRIGPKSPLRMFDLQNDENKQDMIIFESIK
jgi:hypothetical protein